MGELYIKLCLLSSKILLKTCVRAWRESPQCAADSGKGAMSDCRKTRGRARQVNALGLTPPSAESPVDAPGRSVRWGWLRRLPKGPGRARQVNALGLAPLSAERPVGAPGRLARLGWLRHMPKGPGCARQVSALGSVPPSAERPGARPAGQCAGAGSAVCRKAQGAPGRSVRWGWFRCLSKGQWARPAGQRA